MKMLRAGWYGDRIPVETRFSAPVQTCPGGHPASYTMGTALLPGVKMPRHGADHPPPLAPRLKTKVPSLLTLAKVCSKFNFTLLIHKEAIHYAIFSSTRVPRLLRPKYAPQHRIWMFLPQRERPSFTPVTQQAKLWLRVF
jgi:hypothetical protein